MNKAATPPPAIGSTAALILGPLLLGGLFLVAPMTNGEEPVGATFWVATLALLALAIAGRSEGTRLNSSHRL